MTSQGPSYQLWAYQIQVVMAGPSYSPDYRAAYLKINTSSKGFLIPALLGATVPAHLALKGSIMSPFLPTTL